MMTFQNEADTFPEHHVGDKVAYRDRQGRKQFGAITQIDAHWTEPGKAPLIIYGVEHPTYVNKIFYTTEARFL